MSLSSIIGDNFVNKAGTSLTLEQVKADFTLLYFSAHWCPPCRGFTPTLSEFYTKAKAAGKSISVIFASRDSSAEEFSSYFGSMSFDAALPYGDERVQKLMTQWSIRGIPTLVVLDGATGAVLSPNGRGDVTSQGVEALTTWAAARATKSAAAGGAAAATTEAKAEVKDVTSVIGSNFVGHNGELLDRSAIDADIVCLYFSAHWCPPCRGFTPTLSTWYTDLKKAGKSIAVVFASRDSDQKSFEDYFKSMSFPVAFPLNDARVASLMAKWSIRGIPNLVVLSRKGKVIRANGRSDVVSHGVAAYDTWKAEA